MFDNRKYIRIRKKTCFLMILDDDDNIHQIDFYFLQRFQSTKRKSIEKQKEKTVLENFFFYLIIIVKIDAHGQITRSDN